MSTTLPPTPHGSIRSSAGSDSLPNRPSAAEASKASRTSSRKSTASRKTTTNTADPSHGLPPQIPSSKNWQNYVRVFLGQNTSSNKEKGLRRLAASPSFCNRFVTPPDL